MRGQKSGPERELRAVFCILQHAGENEGQQNEGGQQEERHKYEAEVLPPAHGAARLSDSGTSLARRSAPTTGL